MPTTYFDGGNIVHVGSSNLAGSITTCMNRAVTDLDADVKVGWMGGGDLRITATVKSNTPAFYPCYVRVFVTEKQSSLNWKDSGGKLYKFPFLDWAINKLVTLPPNGTWTEEVVWKGSQHNDGYGHTFANIQYDNLQVVIAVFDSTPHQAYSNPPSGGAFTAYYADEANAAVPDALSTDVTSIPEAGGTVNFHLIGYPENANRNYLLFGGISGSSPGTPLPGGQVTLPVNWDLFTNIVIGMANSPLFVNFMGKLNTEGYATARMALPAVAGAAGLQLVFAYACNDPWDFVSDPVYVDITP